MTDLSDSKSDPVDKPKLTDPDEQAIANYKYNSESIEGGQKILIGGAVVCAIFAILFLVFAFFTDATFQTTWFWLTGYMVLGFVGFVALYIYEGKNLDLEKETLKSKQEANALRKELDAIKASIKPAA